MTLFDDDNLADELARLAEAEARRLRGELPDVLAVLEPLIDAAAVLHARRIIADRRWVAEGCDPRSAWLKVSAAALRDYVRLLETITSKASVLHGHGNEGDDDDGDAGRLVLTDDDLEQIIRGG